VRKGGRPIPVFARGDRRMWRGATCEKKDGIELPMAYPYLPL
jgi:hypothetical protein